MLEDTSRMRRRLLPLAALTAALLLSACGAVKIGRINADPMRYRNKTVSVKGTVTNSFGALVAGGYQVEDETGKIFVISTASGVPSKGQQVQVKGRVTPGVTVMGRSFGTAIREQEHEVKF
jgi:hypothetical protein